MAGKRDEQRQKLWQLWERYQSSAKDGFTQSIDKKFKALASTVYGLVKVDGVKLSRLGDNDEKIYGHLVGLMDVYRRVLAFAEGYDYPSPTVQALLMGICEVLNSRLREFDELTGEIKDESPIALEKRDIFDEALVVITENVEDQRERFEVGLREDTSREWDESFDIILQGEFFEVYSHYREGLQTSLAKLDDLHHRQETRFYMELMEREWEELGNIINVQVRVMEDNGVVTPANIEQMTESNVALLGILDALREAYQQSGPVIGNLQNLLHTPPVQIGACRPFDEFEQILKVALEAATPHSPEKQEFINELGAEVTAVLGGLKVDYMKAAYNLQRTVSQDVLLAEEIIEAFVRILNKLPQFIRESIEETDILRGIEETIQIKVAGLRESTQHFYKECLAIIRRFSAEETDLPEDALRGVVETARERWQNALPEVERLESWLDEFFIGLKQTESYVACRVRVQKQIDGYAETLEKVTLAFKREVLLYEICTYEEILTHSVSRLRKSEDAAAVSAAELLDKIFKDMEVILKKSNITVICPEPGESFNPKEHEVLVAEKHSDKPKGEIIKIVTTGYRHKNQVILRANVIAAK